ncbi:hypothetical protein CISG_01738 [Coccidioides immitis RMSCC 3703]|uniref:Uncharacterized protein n=1 Tax=Coccidioides immitis RMSCC 3703 TaxID=454286 RepID=A0A0J8R4Q5_COCIT|nr:hypothetical protein CISG_01738 [Coccidioides immitis RMSCC 3703]
MERDHPPQGFGTRASRRNRSSSLSTDYKKIPKTSCLLSPPLVNPQPQYVVSSAVRQVITADHNAATADRFHNERIDITDAALMLLNGFLDNLLFSILLTAKSTKIIAIRPAVSEVLKPRLAREVVSAADDELGEYIGGSDDEDFPEFCGGQEPSGHFELERSWKLTRLRCMVYSRLGDMEEEDEEDHLRREGLDENGSRPGRFSNHIGHITPAAAIFLTSILEYIGENALLIVAENATTLSRESLLRSPRKTSSRQSSVGTLETVDEPQLRPITSHPPVSENVEPIDPTAIPLPLSDNDVDEIEIPGFTAQLAVAIPARAFRPRSLFITHNDINPRATPEPALPKSASVLEYRTHSRSHSLPTTPLKVRATPPKKAPDLVVIPAKNEEKEEEEVVEDNDSETMDENAEHVNITRTRGSSTLDCESRPQRQYEAYEPQPQQQQPAFTIPSANQPAALSGQQSGREKETPMSLRPTQQLPVDLYSSAPSPIPQKSPLRRYAHEHPTAPAEGDDTIVETAFVSQPSSSVSPPPRLTPLRELFATATSTPDEHSPSLPAVSQSAASSEPMSASSKSDRSTSFQALALLIFKSPELLIESDETLHYTLTPKTMREIEDPGSPRWASVRTGSVDLRDSGSAKGSPTIGGGSNGLRITASAQSPPRGPAPQPRDARAEVKSVREFANFIKHTGPGPNSMKHTPIVIPSSIRQSNMSHDFTSMASPSPVSSRAQSSMSGYLSRPNRPRLEARPAVAPKDNQTSELIDFIREGPPRDGSHRIPRTVAPFRTTMDSDDFHSLSPTRLDRDTFTHSSIASTQDDSVAARSFNSSFNSRTGLLEAVSQGNNRPVRPQAQLHSVLDSPVDEVREPVRSRRRVRDPYAIDTDSEDEFDEQPRRPQKKEESLMDFLRNVPPPPTNDEPPQLLSVNMRAANAMQPVKPRSKSTASTMKSRLMRTTSTDKAPKSKLSRSSLRSQKSFATNPVTTTPADAPALPSLHTTTSSVSSQYSFRQEPYAPNVTTYPAHVDRLRNGYNMGPHPTDDMRTPPHYRTGNSGTAALADFLRNTAPPESPQTSRPPTSSAKESGGGLAEGGFPPSSSEGEVSHSIMRWRTPSSHWRGFRADSFHGFKTSQYHLRQNIALIHAPLIEYKKEVGYHINASHPRRCPPAVQHLSWACSLPHHAAASFSAGGNNAF